VTSPGLWATLLVAAVLAFWVIGAYNRLIALRNDIAAAWARVQEAHSRRGAAVQPLAERLREPMAAEAGAIEAWLAAHGDSHKAAAALTTRPVDAAHSAAWLAAEARLASAAARLLALVEQQRELAAAPDVATLLAVWREGQAALPFARQLFNQAAEVYNEAAAQFPTRIVARGFGLARAGLI
jgi:LemA protein